MALAARVGFLRLLGGKDHTGFQRAVRKSPEGVGGNACASRAWKGNGCR